MQHCTAADKWRVMCRIRMCLRNVAEFGAPRSTSVTMHILRRNLDCFFLLQISEPAVAVSRVSIHENTVTRGNKFKLQNQF